MLNETLKVILAVLVGAGLKLLLVAIGVEIDPVLFNTLVGAIVVWILVRLGFEGAKAAAPNYFKEQ
jgi:hypothetical protein